MIDFKKNDGRLELKLRPVAIANGTCSSFPVIDIALLFWIVDTDGSVDKCAVLVLLDGKIILFSSTNYIDYCFLVIVEHSLHHPI